MTGEEKRRELKEQYKRDLKLRKEYLEKMKNLRKQNNINEALGGMLDAFNDDSQDWIDKLNQDSAYSEAKFDLALDQASEAQKRVERIAQEAEMKKLEAQNLVEKMKREMGLAPEAEASADTSPEESAGESKEEETDSSEAASRPKKSMGDWED